MSEQEVVVKIEKIYGHAAHLIAVENGYQVVKEQRGREVVMGNGSSPVEALNSALIKDLGF